MLSTSQYVAKALKRIQHGKLVPSNNKIPCRMRCFLYALSYGTYVVKSGLLQVQTDNAYRSSRFNAKRIEKKAHNLSGGIIRF